MLLQWSLGQWNEMSYDGSLCFLDTETTGLHEDEAQGIEDPTGHLDIIHPVKDYRVIEISFIVTRPWPSMEILGECHTKLKLSPEDKAKAHPKALEVNGYTDEAWADAIESDASFWYEVHRVTTGTVRVMQNIAFDSSFVYAEMKRYGFKPQWQRRYEEMYTYCARLARDHNIIDPKTGLTSWGLAQVYDAMGFPKLPEHSAKPDVLRMIRIYCHMQQRLDRSVR
jgi:DNA polymerase III epsilon subunit-like protein